MKKWNIKIVDLGIELEAEYEAGTKQEAEEMARNDYSVELDCSPEDVNIIEISEKQEEEEMTRTRLLENNINHLLGGYENGISDCGYEEFPQMTMEELVEYVYSQVFDIRDDGYGTTAYGEGIADELKFLGTTNIKKIIEQMCEGSPALKEDAEQEEVTESKQEEKPVEIKEEKKMKNITAEVVMKYIPKKNQIKIAELILEDLGNRKTRYIVKLNENYWLDGNREFQIENFKELLATLKDKVVFDETPEPWLEADPLDVHKPDTMSKTAYMKQMRVFFRENMAGNTEEISFKEWFNEHMIGLELDGKIVKEIRNGKEITLVMV